MASNKYRTTLLACFTGYIIQALVVNFPPLLFVFFQKHFGFSLPQLSLLVTMTFAIQIMGDLLIPRIVRFIGQRWGLVLANVFAALGLIAMGILPRVTEHRFAAIVFATLLYSLGASFIEVLVSPVVEAIPTKKKSATMGLLHSFFCWGSILVVVGSTVFFLLFGIEKWPYLALMWAVLPIVNGILFTRVPLATLSGDTEEHRMGALQLLKSRVVVLLLLLMTCAGASEITISQWVSAMAEEGLGVSKTMGDLLGPTLFALCMGLGRLYYAKHAAKLKLEQFLLWGMMLCAAGYMVVALSPWPVVNLLACGLCGVGISMAWPGTLSLGARKVPAGGTMLFALMAFGGDVGAAVGPALAGLMANILGGRLQFGICCAIIFPLVGIWTVCSLKREKKA